MGGGGRPGGAGSTQSILTYREKREGFSDITPLHPLVEIYIIPPQRPRINPLSSLCSMLFFYFFLFLYLTYIYIYFTVILHTHPTTIIIFFPECTIKKI